MVAFYQFIKNPEPLSYRNSCKLPFGEEYGELYTGMYERDTNHFQKMERCYVHSKLVGTNASGSFKNYE